MTTATLSPFRAGNATQIGPKVYRKQVLPIGSIDYNGTRVDFDLPFLTDLAESFNDGAYDQVPFVLADADNRHTMDPERFRGVITALEMSDTGLDMVVEVNARGAEVLADNPNLGVSARIVQDLAKADGRTFRRAVQHVLGTMNPKVSGLGPWQAVDLSEDDDIQVVDLTTATYEEDSMALDLSTLTDNEFLELLDLTDAEEGESDVALLDREDDEDDEDDEVFVEAEADDDTEVVFPPVMDDDDDEDDETDLSDVMDSDARDATSILRAELAEARFHSERLALLNAGVPRALIDLAEPLLNTPDQVILDLSDSDGPVNATQIARNLLNQVKGMIDIKPEIGHQIDLSAADDTRSADDALLAAWDSEYGTV